MAYVNVAEWKPEQVTEWLKGLDNAVLLYIHSFLNNEVSGQQLLNLRPDDLDHLGVQKLGHQEIILEAVEHLRNFHYELDRENLQLLALRVACRARSLHNELRHTTDTIVTTQTLADVANIITAVKPLVCWLDGSPFSGHLDYQDRKSELLKLSLEIATVAHRDRFSEAPVRAIRDFSGSIAAKADSIIQDIVDPLILQPASLDLATLKKRAGDDLGILIVPSFHGVHQIAEIKYSSPAHSCGKIEEGDEVVQVNYQTVVGWQTKQVMALFEECPTDVFLTLKKRPRHTKVYGQIYMKPYRLPSKKRAAQYTRWHDNLPSPRPELLTIPDFEIPLPRAAPKPACPADRPPLPPLPRGPPSESSEEDEEDEDDESFLAGGVAGGQASPTSMRLYLPKPRVTVQRRATVTGASPTSKRPPVNIQQFWRELRQERQWKEGGSDGCGGGTGAGRGDGPQLYQLRDKSASFGNGFGLDTPPRPSTCLGIEKGGRGRGGNKMEDIVESSPVRGGGEKAMSPRADELTSILRTQRANKDSEKADETTGGINGAVVSPTEVPAKKDVRFGATVYGAAGIGDEANVNGTDSEKKERGRLDKSHSTPAYDTSETESTEGSPVEKSFPPPKPKPKPPKPPKRAAKRSQDQPPAAVAAEKPKIALDEPLTSLILETINSALIERLRENNVDIPSRMEVDDRPTVTALPDCPREVVSGLPDYHEIAGGDVMPDAEGSKHDKPSRLSFDHQTHYDGVQICVTPPEPPPRPGLGFDQSKPGASSTNQSKSNFYNFDPSTVNAFNSSQSHVNASSPGQSAANASGPGQSVANASGSVQTVPSTSSSTQSLPSTSSLQLKSISSSSVHSAMSSPSVESKSAASAELGNKSSPPEGGGKPGVGYRAMQAALSLGRNKSVFSSATLPSPRSARKKNALLAKRRNISAADLGACDLEGWLCHRRRGTPGTGGAATWRRAWFALKGATLYGYHDRNSARAHLMIALPGFTASPAQEVKSRRFAFKVYHTGTVFYFAGETEEELATWLDSICAATVSQDVGMTETVVFSESDDGSDLDTPSPSPSPKVRRFANLLGVHSASQQHVAATADTKSSDVQKKFGSLKKLGRKQSQQQDGLLPPPPPPPHHDVSSLDRKYLRIFGSGRHPQPVPTAQFRSYRRVLPPPPPPPTAAAAPQLGQFYLSSDSVFHDSEFPESVKKSASFHDSPVVPAGPPSYETVVRDPSYEPQVTPPVKDPAGSPLSRDPGVSPPGKDPSYEPPLSPPPVGRPGHTEETNPELRSRNEIPPCPASDRSDRNSRFRGSNTVSRISKPPPKKPEKPSNSRVKNLDYRERQIHASNPSLLMPSDMSYYRLAAERLREFGIQRNRQREDTSGFVTLEEFMLSRQEEERKQRGHMGGGANVNTGVTTGNAGATTGNVGAANGNAGTNNGNVGTTTAQRKVSGNGNVARGKREEQQQEYRGGSTDKFWVDSLRGGRGKPLKTAQVSDVNSNQLPPRLKAAATYQPPPPLSGDEPPLMKLAFEMHLDKSDAAAPAGKTSKFRNLFTSRSASQKHLLETPAVVGVGSATSPGVTQKTLLGSPRLHRAIFRDKKAKNAADSSSSSLSSPASPPFDWPTESFASQSDSGGAQSKPTMGVSMLGKKRTQPPSPSPSQSSPPPDYPGLEYPPVFEPETYTLTDASSLMRAKKIN